MKIPIALSVLLMSAGCWSCSGNSSNQASDSAAPDKADLSATEETVQSDLLVTSDLAYAELKGKVKSVQNENSDDKIEFDENGTIKSGLPRLKRDEDGRVSSWGYDEYFVTWENGLPKTFTIRESDGGESCTTYIYDTDRRLVKASIACEYPGSDPFTEERTYTYTSDSFDSCGNWVKRNVVSNQPGVSFEETRHIEYYD